MKIGIIHPGDPLAFDRNASLQGTRFAAVGECLTRLGATVIAAPYHDAQAFNIYDRLRGVDGVLVWMNPIDRGRDRIVLNALLRRLSSEGAYVSAHPDTIARLGNKEVLYHTRTLQFGSDVDLYEDLAALEQRLPQKLLAGQQRVLKQLAGHSGLGIWLVQPGHDANTVRVRHAQRGSPERMMRFDELRDLMAGYFEQSGKVIDQAYQPTIARGMVRCYLVGERIAGFGHQAINALVPGSETDPALQPGPRLYHPADKPEFQSLKQRVESRWIAQLLEARQLSANDLPSLWDIDFIPGEVLADGDERFVLCEINCSSVSPFPDSALEPMCNDVIERSSGRTSVGK